jgi:predicted dehydrogenase
VSAAERGEPVRIGLLGGGAVAQVAHLPAYRRLRTARLVAICEQEAPKRRALRERTGVEHAVSGLDELLALDEVDAVDVCLPSDLHRDAVVRCLEAGKHVLCEKPLGLTADEVADVIAAQERSGKIVMVGMNNRFRDDSILLKESIDEGTLGDVYYARARWHKRREAVRQEAWYYQSRRSGGGVVMDLGLPMLDLALWLCDYPAPRRVTASFFYHLVVDVEDTAVVTLSCEGGLAISIETSWNQLWDRKQAVLGERDHFFAVVGTEGSGLLDPLRVYQRMHGDLVNVTPTSQRRGRNLYMESYEREIAFFAELVAGREEAPPLSEQLALARVLDAVRRSAREGREVEIVADGASVA